MCCECLLIFRVISGQFNFLSFSIRVNTVIELGRGCFGGGKERTWEKLNRFGPADYELNATETVCKQVTELHNIVVNDFNVKNSACLAGCSL